MIIFSFWSYRGACAVCAHNFPRISPFAGSSQAATCWESAGRVTADLEML